MKINIIPTTKKSLLNLSRLSKKKLVKIAKLSFSPEQAKIGPALAQLGINSMEFCERFNFQTRGLDKDLLIYVRLSVFSDKSFIFSLKQFQLRDLVSSFDLDSFWLQVIPVLEKLKDQSEVSELKKNKNFNEFLVSVYRSFLIFNLSNQKPNDLINYTQFIKLFFSYLKSYQ